MSFTKPPKWRSIFKKGTRKTRYPKIGSNVITWHDITGVDLMCFLGNHTFASCLGFLGGDVTHYISLGKGVQEKLRDVGYCGILTTKKKLKFIVKRFRVLSGWTVTYGSDNSKYKNQCSHDTKTKRLHIFPYKGKLRDRPRDYLLHEVIHGAIAAVNEEGISFKERRFREELLVQDLCRMIRY